MDGRDFEGDQGVTTDAADAQDTRPKQRSGGQSVIHRLRQHGVRCGALLKSSAVCRVDVDLQAVLSGRTPDERNELAALILLQALERARSTAQMPLEQLLLERREAESWYAGPSPECPLDQLMTDDALAATVRMNELWGDPDALSDDEQQYREPRHTRRHLNGSRMG